MTKYEPTRLARARKAAGLSRRESARAVNRSHYTIIDYEHGRRRPSVDALAVLADLFGCTVDDFYEAGVG